MESIFIAIFFICFAFFIGVQVGEIRGMMKARRMVRNLAEDVNSLTNKLKK